MWDDFEWDPENIPGIKLGAHIFQILLSFVAWCLGIAVFRAEGSQVNGQNGWTFAVCFLSIPAWIYLIGCPRFPRTRRFAEPHVMVAVDALYTILWLSAFSTQAAFNTANSCGTACSASKAIVAMGVFVTLLFAGTTFLSIYTLKYYQFNGRLPGYDTQRGGPTTQNIDPDKAAFSMAPHDDEAYAPVNLSDHDNDRRNDYDDHHSGYGGGGSAYGGGAGSSIGGGAGGYPNSSLGRDPYRDPTPPGGRQSNPFDRSDNPFDDDHEYRAQVQPVGQPGLYAPPHVQDDYDDTQPAKFPAANYDRVVR